LFRLFDLLPALEQVAISARDVVSSVIGSLLFLLGWWIWDKFAR
jgi:hypothetical protein